MINMEWDEMKAGKKHQNYTSIFLCYWLIDTVVWIVNRVLLQAIMTILQAPQGEPVWIIHAYASFSLINKPKHKTLDPVRHV